jgi:hypothetical protein
VELLQAAGRWSDASALADRLVGLVPKTREHRNSRWYLACVAAAAHAEHDASQDRPGPALPDPPPGDDPWTPKFLAGAVARREMRAALAVLPSADPTAAAAACDAAAAAAGTGEPAAAYAEAATVGAHLLRHDAAVRAADPDAGRHHAAAIRSAQVLAGRLSPQDPLAAAAAAVASGSDAALAALRGCLPGCRCATARSGPRAPARRRCRRSRGRRRGQRDRASCGLRAQRRRPACRRRHRRPERLGVRPDCRCATDGVARVGGHVPRVAADDIATGRSERPAAVVLPVPGVAGRARPAPRRHRHAAVHGGTGPWPPAARPARPPPVLRLRRPHRAGRGRRLPQAPPAAVRPEPGRPHGAPADRPGAPGALRPAPRRRDAGSQRRRGVLPAVHRLRQRRTEDHVRRGVPLRTQGDRAGVPRQAEGAAAGDPLLEGRLSRRDKVAGGFDDLLHDDVIAELKVEKTTPRAVEDYARYIGQPTQYGVGRGSRLSVLVVLDHTRKSAPPAVLKNHIGWLLPAHHGLDDPRYPVAGERSRHQHQLAGA